MKIAVIGYSGSGKSTLSAWLAQRLSCPVLHLDAVYWTPGWKPKPLPDQCREVLSFLSENECWIVDGNYKKLHFDFRMEQADLIVELLFNRFACLFRARRRYRKYRGSTRPDMGPGCNEKFDLAFIRWILREGRTRKTVKTYRKIAETYRGKTVILKNQKELDRFMRDFTASPALPS